MRPPAPRRPPVTALSHTVQEAPKLAHRRPEVPMDSSCSSGETRDTRPRAVLAPAPTRSPTRPHVATSQRVAKEASKLAHGRSRPPLGSPSRPRELASDTTVHDAPVTCPVPATRTVHVFKATKFALQRTPEHYNPTARSVRPPQQRTLVRAHDRRRDQCAHRRVCRSYPTSANRRANAPSSSLATMLQRQCTLGRFFRTRAQVPPLSRALRGRTRSLRARAFGRLLLQLLLVIRPRHCLRALATTFPLQLLRAHAPGLAYEPQRDHRQADSSSARSPPRKRRPARSPEEGRFPDRSRESSLSALQANPRLSTPPMDPSILFPPEGGSDSVTVRQQPWFGTLVRALVKAIKPALSDSGHEPASASSPLKRKRGVSPVDPPPRPILSPRRSLCKAPSPPQTFSPSPGEEDYPSSGESDEPEHSPISPMAPPLPERSSRPEVEKSLPPSLLESCIPPRREPKDSKMIPKSSARIRQELSRAAEDVHMSPQGEPMGTGDFAASPSGGKHQESEHKAPGKRWKPFFSRAHGPLSFWPTKSQACGLIRSSSVGTLWPRGSIIRYPVQRLAGSDTLPFSGPVIEALQTSSSPAAPSC
ncbi:serine/arginine repetitive matrix protein 1-like [Palaemon carinicauda]|uniref:serine/arginine repetitive matrix protein 1-like n=1 Tax=Palaemon carinicauda TaxID=392227 RepID=UPI0035B5EA6E